MSAKTKQSILSLSVLRISIAIVVLILASYVYTKIDLSRGKNFTLGKYSKETVAELQERVVVKVFASKDLPGELGNVNRFLKDLLTEYRSAGRGKFSFEYARFKDNADLLEQARTNGLSSTHTQLYENDQLVLKEVALGIVIECAGKAMPLSLGEAMEPILEYEITKIIQNLSGKALPNVWVYQDSMYTKYNVPSFYNELAENYEVHTTFLDSIPQFYPVMLFTGTNDSLTEDQLYNLDQYIMKGGKLVLLQDRIKGEQTGIFTLESNLFTLLEHYGILIHPNMVMDRNCDYLNIALGKQVPVPFFPIIRGMDKSPISRNTGATILYFASEVSATDSVNIRFEPILQTSADSGRLNGPVYNLDPIVMAPGGSYPLGKPPITVAASFKGKFTSFYADKPELQREGFIKSQKEGQIAVFADKDLYFLNQEAPEFNRKFIVVLNAMDYLLENPSMIQVRTRQMYPSILNIPYYMYVSKIMPAEPEPVISRINFIFKIIAIVLPSLLLIILGSVVWLKNSSKGA